MLIAAQVMTLEEFTLGIKERDILANSSGKAVFWLIPLSWKKSILKIKLKT